MKFNKLAYPTEITKIILGQEVKIKPYLVTSEIASIVYQMKEYDSYIKREMVKGLCILNFCTDINVKDEDYDLYRANGIIDSVMNEIKEEDLLLIDEAIYHEDSVNKTIKDFCDGMNKNLSEIKPNEMMEGLVNNLKDLQDKQNAIQEH